MVNARDLRKIAIIVAIDVIMALFLIIHPERITLLCKRILSLENNIENIKVTWMFKIRIEKIELHVVFFEKLNDGWLGHWHARLSKSIDKFDLVK